MRRHANSVDKKPVSLSPRFREKNIHFLTFSATAVHLLLSFLLYTCCFWVLDKQYFVALRTLWGLFRTWLPVSKHKKVQRYVTQFHKLEQHQVVFQVVTKLKHRNKLCLEQDLKLWPMQYKCKPSTVHHIRVVLWMANVDFIHRLKR